MLYEIICTIELSQEALEIMAKALQVKPKCSNLQGIPQTPATNLPSINGAPPLAGNPQWCALLLFLYLWLV
jgi:hypothetical protein